MMQMPLEFADGEHINILDELNTKMPELLQETHACFLSLIRDILCSTPDHRMSLEDLKRKVNFWLLNPITPLNEWYHQSENWLLLLPSAVFFLTGEFTDQPEDFVPYLEYKAHLNIYQWIGAGRDTDNNLVPLCNYWLSRRNDMGNNKNFAKTKGISAVCNSIVINSKSENVASLDRSITPPPARFITDWVVTPATPDEIKDFQEQERRRYENPHMAFTYYQHGYESIVGPVKGIYTEQVHGIAKARGHNMLVANRPNFVTILTLVRDATARLPNGEGTRADICELLKSSQYINPAANDQVLQTIVSGALDRMHTETDPCVKYDSRRKIWIYLHRNRSESEFEKMHQQQQCITKPKKIIYKKTKSKLDDTMHAKNASTDEICTNSTPIHNVSQSGISAKHLISNPASSVIVNSVNNKNVVIPTINSKNNVQNILTAKSVPIQVATVSPPSYTQPSKRINNSNVTQQALNTKPINAQQICLNENNIINQKDLPDLGKIGIIPQKFIQVSPNRFQSHNKGNIITLNKSQPLFVTDKQKQLIQPKVIKRNDAINTIKIPMSLANQHKLIQVKPVSGNLPNVLPTENLPTLKRSNLQVIKTIFIPTIKCNSALSQNCKNYMNDFIKFHFPRGLLP